MESVPVPSVIEYDSNGTIVGWTNAFGKYKFDAAKGISTNVGPGIEMFDEGPRGIGFKPGEGQ